MKLKSDLFGFTKAARVIDKQCLYDDEGTSNIAITEGIDDRTRRNKIQRVHLK